MRKIDEFSKAHPEMAAKIFQAIEDVFEIPTNKLACPNCHHTFVIQLKDGVEEKRKAGRPRKALQSAGHVKLKVKPFLKTKTLPKFTAKGDVNVHTLLVDVAEKQCLSVGDLNALFQRHLKNTTATIADSKEAFRKEKIKWLKAQLHKPKASLKGVIHSFQRSKEARA